MLHLQKYKKKKNLILKKLTNFQYCEKPCRHIYLQAIHVHSQIREALTGHVRGRIETLTWPSKQVLLSGIGL